jgi:hypothetical protein
VTAAAAGLKGENVKWLSCVVSLYLIKLKLACGIEASIEVGWPIWRPLRTYVKEKGDGEKLM